MLGSMYDPYYGKVQELLFDGMDMKEAHEYMRVFFGLYSTYDCFWQFCKNRGLTWFCQNRNPNLKEVRRTRRRFAKRRRKAQKDE